MNLFYHASCVIWSCQSNWCGEIKLSRPICVVCQCWFAKPNGLAWLKDSDSRKVLEWFIFKNKKVQKIIKKEITTTLRHRIVMDSHWENFAFVHTNCLLGKENYTSRQISCWKKWCSWSCTNYLISIKTICQRFCVVGWCARDTYSNKYALKK